MSSSFSVSDIGPCTGGAEPDDHANVSPQVVSDLESKTDPGSFWLACCVLWSSLLEHPLLPHKDSHEHVLRHLQSMYVAVIAQLPPEKPMDEVFQELVRKRIVKNLCHIGRGLEILCTKLGAQTVYGQAEVHAFLRNPELRWLSLWVDGIVDQEQDEEKVWDVCGYCLLHAVDALKEILPLLELIHSVHAACERSSEGLAFLT